MAAQQPQILQPQTNKQIAAQAQKNQFVSGVISDEKAIGPLSPGRAHFVDDDVPLDALIEWDERSAQRVARSRRGRRGKRTS